jgi:hypothetical protein
MSGAAGSVRGNDGAAAPVFIRRVRRYCEAMPGIVNMP